ncbi:hypothetical protein [Bacillus rhizoplanae]|uniref:hypothetical protein n=1 Tax=Bacillus rhizoplanae TaxID=2880966 RepID=UPI003D205B7F
MILDDAIVQFLTRTEPLFIHLAVSGAEHRPYSVRCFGVRTYEGIAHLSIYILKSQTEKVLSYIREGNSTITCLFTDGISNESYQIKGTFLQSKQSEDEKDLEILKCYREGSLKMFPKMYTKFPLSIANCDRITYRVTDIFVHTPGPYAGRKYKKGESKRDS